MRLMDPRIAASFEFASFVAEISDPATGAILSAQLAERLGMSEERLWQDWHASGLPEWKDFAQRVLALLDATHDVTMALPATMTWDGTWVLLEGPGWTPAECVAHGAFREALAAIKELRQGSLNGSSSIWKKG